MEAAKSFFLRPSPERNFACIVEGENLWVSKESLSMYSPVFQRMFYGEFRESNVNSQEFPEKRFSDFLTMLRCIMPCPAVRGRVDRSNCVPLIRLADEYEIEDLKVRCSKVLISVLKEYDFTTMDLDCAYILSWECDVDNFFNYYDLAVLCRYNDVVQRYMPMAAYLCQNGSSARIADYTECVKSAIEKMIEKRNSLVGHKLDMIRRIDNVDCGCLVKKNHFKCQKCFKPVCPKDGSECNVMHKVHCKYRHEKINRSSCPCGYVN